jgi:hypothetical protein
MFGYCPAVTDADEQTPDPHDDELEVPGLPADDDGDDPITDTDSPMPV